MASVKKIIMAAVMTLAILFIVFWGFVFYENSGSRRRCPDMIVPPNTFRGGAGDLDPCGVLVRPRTIEQLK